MPTNMITELAMDVPATKIRPREFFVAFQGVPTLAYCEFSNGLLNLKKALQHRVPGLKPENPGSMWPKTTLGALKDGAVLTWDQAYALRQICTALNAKIQADAWSLDVRSLSVVVFQCRSLEKRLATHLVELRGASDQLTSDPAPRSHTLFVDQTMAQFAEDRLSDYLPKLQLAGNRESDYTKDHIEATLVCDLGQQQPPYIQDFIDRVDEELGGLYYWFTPESRHMTVRGLVTP